MPDIHSTTTDPRILFGERLIELRKAKGWSQERLSLESGGSEELFGRCGTRATQHCFGQHLSIGRGSGGFSGGIAEIIIIFVVMAHKFKTKNLLLNVFSHKYLKQINYNFLKK